ncbi:MAG TPA: hypothetical protein VFS38_01655 [Actinomycetota bacterium]|nr:hypothetical protein [Actinomycetota bacterium]
MTLSPEALRTAGVLLLTIVAIEWGGSFLLRVVRGRYPATDFQKAFFRAGHAHAGVLVTLALVCQILADATDQSGLPAALARSGVPLAAILMPAGFFLSAAGKELTQPNRLVVLLYAGAVSLGAGVVSLGIGLLTA